MKNLKILFGVLVVFWATFIAYSCVKDSTNISEDVKLGVELRSRCGDNTNVAPMPIILPSQGGPESCCYEFIFKDVPVGTEYEIFGFNNSGTYIGGTSNNILNNFCAGELDNHHSTALCCFDITKITSVTISLSDGSCISFDLTTCN